MVPSPNTFITISTCVNLEVDSIESERKRAISDIYAIVSHFIDKYQCGVVNCKSFASYTSQEQGRMNFACDGSILGTLLKSATDSGLWPPPPPPYTGVDLITVIGKAQSLEIMALCDYISFGYGENRPGSNHGVKASIQVMVKSTEMGVVGLDIKDLKPA
jgi:hypothetical protein